MELGFSGLKQKEKGNILGFPCASHFTFVDSIPMRVSLFPAMRYSAWNFHGRYFKVSYSWLSEAYF